MIESFLAIKEYKTFKSECGLITLICMPINDDWRSLIIRSDGWDLYYHLNNGVASFKLSELLSSRHLEVHQDVWYAVAIFKRRSEIKKEQVFNSILEKHFSKELV